MEPAADGQDQVEQNIELAAASAAEPSTESLRALHVRHDISLMAIFKVGGTILLAWLLSKAWSVFVLILLAIMLTATFTPVVRRLEVRLNRVLGISAVVLGLAAFVVLFFALIIPPLMRQGQSLVQHLPDYAAAMEAMAERHHIPFRFSPLPRGLLDQMAGMGPQVLSMITTLLSGVMGMATVAVMTLYLLLDGQRLMGELIRLAPRQQRLPLRQMLSTLAMQVGGYIRGQLFVSGLAGLFTFVLLLCFRVPEPLALAFLVAVADAIPVVGLIISMAAVLLMALTRGASIALLVGALYFIYHQIEINVVLPRIYGSTMKLPPFVIIIALLVGATLMGILGMLLALPVAAALPVVVRFAGEWRDRQVEKPAPDLP